MTQFNKGTLIVVLATVVTSILILMTGREKENSAPSESNNVAENVESTTTEQKISTDAESVKSVSSEDENVTDEKVIVDDPVEIAAPDGPFNNKEEAAPIQAAADNIQASAVDEQNKADQDVQENSVNITTASTESQHELLNHIIQPIWMDQKLGDFKSVAQGEVVFNLMPTNQDGLQGKNPGKVVTSKEDKFAATIISADYNYQQMPMYNGGYYIAPMPQYLMPSVLPTSIDSKIDN